MIDKVVFFDGDCGVCNAFVQFVLEHDQGTFFFAPLQGTTAKQRFGQVIDMTTVIFAEGENVYFRSDAVLRITRLLSGWWRWFSVFRFIPRFVRDPLYNLFVRNRHFLWPKSATCRLLTPEEKRRFLP